MTSPVCTLDVCDTELDVSNEFELLVDSTPSGAVYFCTALHATIWSITEKENNNE